MTYGNRTKILSAKTKQKCIRTIWYAYYTHTGNVEIYYIILGEGIKIILN